MTRIIKKCSLCGSSKIYRRLRIEGEKYHCDACKQNFSNPTFKEAQGDLNKKALPVMLRKYVN